MNKPLSRGLSWLLAVVMLAGMLPLSAFADSWDGAAAVQAPLGDGTEAEPFQITDAADLKWFADKVNGAKAKDTVTLCATLTADIDLAGQAWTPIGRYNSYSDCVYYGGVFDGNGKTVSGLWIDTDKAYQALFGYVKGATIKHLTVAGTVKTTATSSAYAAGIVAYGSPVTLENCHNRADVTATAKGYAAGVAAATYTGSSMTGCTNDGTIAGHGDYVGGIVGTATGGTSIRASMNRGEVCNTGAPSSYAYSTGGIAGGASGNSTIVQCGNTGCVTSTLKRTGGIVGSLGGHVETCFNTGDVTGTYGVGGIVGDSADKASTITSCYNLGRVTGRTPTATYNDANAKGVGGVIGGVASNTYKASLRHCYNAGTVALVTTLADVLAGGIVGDSSGNNYSGEETSALVTADTCYFDKATAAQGNGRDAAAAGIQGKSQTDMTAAGFATLVGADYIDDPTGGYPLLGWQDPNARYTVTFTLEPAGAALTVSDDQGTVLTAEEGTTYRLPNGAYTYTVTGEECEPVSGHFTVAYGGQDIPVSLTVKTYDVVFVTEPVEAVLTVEGQTPLADGRTYRLAKRDNPYTYTVSAFGYDTVTGTVTVTGEAEQDQYAVMLTPQPRHTVTIPTAREEGGSESSVQVQVISNAWPTATILPQDDGTFLLPDGAYTYTVSSAGYKSVKGEVTVAGADVTLPQAFLAIQTAWDGESMTQPAQDSENVYLITTPDELMWFQQHAALTASARLMADICINEDITADPATLYRWKPVGATSSKAYTGDFDGNGHTLSGLYVMAADNNAGVFGFVGAGGRVHDVTIADSRITGTKNYTGAIVGDLKGSLHNCHVTATVSVTGKAYVGGVVGELDTGGTVSQCSNAGRVTGSGVTNADGYVGGIAGRVYANTSNALTDSVNTGDVSGYHCVGGIAGTLYGGGTLQEVYATGRVTATRETAGEAGGLVGHIRAGAIRRAYAAGTVSAARRGGVVGGLEATGQVKTWDTVLYLADIADGAVGYENGCAIQGTAQACTPAELSIMAAALGDAFYENDTAQNNGYPLLYWQVGEQMTDPNAPAPHPDGWNGKTSSTPPLQQAGVYQIATPGDLKWFARAAKTTLDIQGVLTADIDLNYQPWTPIGGVTADTAFAGVLNGNGHAIDHLYITTGSPAGLFAYTAGTVRDLTVRGIVCSADHAAAVAAYNSGTVTGVTASVSLTGGNRVAGIVAQNDKSGMVSGCRNTGAITGGQQVAGIVAVNKGAVLDSGNTGAITGTGAFVAGVVADNDGGTVKTSANTGQIIGKAAVRLAYVSGVIGRNNGVVQRLYNSGNVVGLGSSVGGCVAINTTGSQADELYNAGDVCGTYMDTEDGEEFRVGGAVGEMVSGVSHAYTLNTLTIQTGGDLVSADELAQKAGSLATMLPAKSGITGRVTLGSWQVNDTAAVVYEGNAAQPVVVWYWFDGSDEMTLAVSDGYTIPAHMVGRRLYAKVMDPALSGVVTGASDTIDGFTGSVRINGYAVVGHTLQAAYTGSDPAPVYQWYRGATKIEGATSSAYAVTAEDEGKILTLRVTGSKPGYIERKTAVIQTGAQAGVWPSDETDEPVKIAGTYVITTEAELKWFTSFVNGGHPTAEAKLANDIALTAAQWYPIGNSRYPYEGVFDGNGKTVSGLTLTAEADEQGFFGHIGGKGTVKELAVSGTVAVRGNDTVATGGVAGYLDGKVTRCTFTGRVSGVQDVGGLVGQAGMNSTISECQNNGRVQGKENVGGIAGSVSYGQVTACANTGAVGSEDVTRMTGGIAGQITNYAVITASYNTGRVSGHTYLGGIAGAASVCAAPQGCYNVGKVGPGFYAYGVLGDLSGTEYIPAVQGSYYLAESPAAATDKTAQGVNASGMKKAAFVSLLNAQSGKTLFVMDVKEANGGYPLLLWQTGTSSSGDDTENPDDPPVLTVTFTLCGDTAHGPNGGHVAYVDWIESAVCTLPKGSTAYDLFQKMMSDYGLSFEAFGNGYVASVTGPNKVTLAEFQHGPRSGWMYTINDAFPNYMKAVPLKNGDHMRFFYTDDYKDTTWTPFDPVVAAVEDLIDAIGDVTLDSGEAIETAREAYALLTDGQRWMISNSQTLEEAERTFARLLAEKPLNDQAAATAVDKQIHAIGDVNLNSWEAIRQARAAYDALTDDQKALVTELPALTNAEKRFAQLVGEKTAADMAAANAVDQLVAAIGTVTVRSGAAIDAAQAAYDALTNDQKAYVTTQETLQQARQQWLLLVSQKHVQREEIYNRTAATLQAGPVPTVSVVGGEWAALGLARSGRLSHAFATGYYENLVKALRETGSAKLHAAKSTENSRAVLALTALGYDAAHVDGYNLLQPLADAEYLAVQGVNGPIWALIAFDTANYLIPAAESGQTQVTREGLVRMILDEQTAAGGWSQWEEAGDADLTAMALQALAPYIEDPAVKTAVDKALAFLSARQRADGGFTTLGEACAENSAQVVIALTALGIDPDADARFVKNGRSVLDNLLTFYQDGTFRHTVDGEPDGMATEQSYLALAAYTRFMAQERALWDMRDVVKTDNPVVKPTPTPDPEPNPTPEPEPQPTPDPQPQPEPVPPIVSKPAPPEQETPAAPETGEATTTLTGALLLMFLSLGMVSRRRRKPYNG